MLELSSIRIVKPELIEVLLSSIEYPKLRPVKYYSVKTLAQLFVYYLRNKNESRYCVTKETFSDVTNCLRFNDPLVNLQRRLHPAEIGINVVALIEFYSEEVTEAIDFQVIIVLISKE